MADGSIQLNVGVNGSIMDEEAVSYGSAPTTRHRSRVVVGGSVAEELARVTDDNPASDDFGLVTRPTPLTFSQSTGTISGTGTTTAVDVTRANCVILTITSGAFFDNLVFSCEGSIDGTNFFTLVGRVTDGNSLATSFSYTDQDDMLFIPFPSGLTHFRLNVSSLDSGEPAYRIAPCLLTMPLDQRISQVNATGSVTVTQSTASNLKVDLSGTGANSTAVKVDGSAVTQPVSGTVTATPVATSLAHAARTIANTATQLSTSSLPTTQGVEINNISTSVTVYFGGSGVTTSNGFPLLPSSSMLFPVNNANLVYGIVASGTQEVRYISF